MEMLEGTLTPEKEGFIISEKQKLDEAEMQVLLLDEQKQKGEISLQEYIQGQERYSEILNDAKGVKRLYEKYLHIKAHPGTEFIYDTGYEKIFGISDEKFSLTNSALLLCVFALCFCGAYSVDYKTEAYKILCTTRYGTDKTRKAKTKALICLSAVIFLVAYVPELIYIGRFYGFPGLSGQMISIPSLGSMGALPIWAGLIFLYALRFSLILSFIPVISALSLKRKNPIVTAIIFNLVFLLPLVIYGVLNIRVMYFLSLQPLLSGDVLTSKLSFIMGLFQLAALLSLSLLCNRFVRRNYPKAVK